VGYLQLSKAETWETELVDILSMEFKHQHVDIEPTILPTNSKLLDELTEKATLHDNVCYVCYAGKDYIAKKGNLYETEVIFQLYIFTLDRRGEYTGLFDILETVEWGCWKNRYDLRRMDLMPFQISSESGNAGQFLAVFEISKKKVYPESI